MFEGNLPTYKSDVWALGCTLYQLCNFELPFGDNPMKIKTEKHPQIREKYSDELRIVVDRCLAKEIAERPTVADLLDGEFIARKAKSLGIYNADYFTPLNKTAFCWLLLIVLGWMLFLISLPFSFPLRISERILRSISLCTRNCLWLMRGNRGSDSSDQMGTQSPISEPQNYINKWTISSSRAHSKPAKEGIPNIGFTCSLNLVLQILASTKEFQSNLNSDCEFSTILVAIIKMINREAPPCFKEKISKLLNFFKQTYSTFPLMLENSKELFTIIINECAQNSEELKEIFFIRSNKSFKCERGHIVKSKDESVFLATSGIFSEDLTSLIKRLEQPTLFNDNNKLYCNTCQDLKDFYVTGELILPKILTFYFPEENPKDRHIKDSEAFKGQEYKLYGLICFYPSYRHYVAFTLDNEIWMEYNDEHVSQKNPDYYYAYMAFYRRIG